MVITTASNLLAQQNYNEDKHNLDNFHLFDILKTIISAFSALYLVVLLLSALLHWSKSYML